MPVQFRNFEFSYRNKKGKPVFVPSERSYEIGWTIKTSVEELVPFPAYYMHLRPGGHVAALHRHRSQKYFARIDLRNFFYSISRARVVRSLRHVQLSGHQKYGKWSCVKNPYFEQGGEYSTYALPYGFVQSPILATLVLRYSALGDFLGTLPNSVTVTVYLDDIAISSDNLDELRESFEVLESKAMESNFILNDEKKRAPAEYIELFNCDLAHDTTKVTDARIAEFFSALRSEPSKLSFERYCASVIGAF